MGISYSSNTNIALIIGINYIGTDNELSGCINDVASYEQYLIENNYVKPDNITTMVDTHVVQNIYYPSTSNVKLQINELIDHAILHPNDKLFLSYSGHGYFIPDISGDELDGYDEVICPIGDYITDDYLYEMLSKLPSTTQLFVIIDACHSGTMLDLDSTHHNIKANVVCISGCMDNQSSADAYIAGKYQGALTSAIVYTMCEDITYGELMHNLTLKLKAYGQSPQLSSTRNITSDDTVMITTY